jgi:hypothetical protein
MKDYYLSGSTSPRGVQIMEALMVTLRAQIISRAGKKEYAVLPYEEFLKIQEQLQEYEDIRCLREAKEAEGAEPTIGIDELRKDLGIRAPRARPSTKQKPRI